MTDSKISFKKVITIIATIFVLSAFSIGSYYDWKTNKEIKENSAFAIGEIVKFDRRIQYADIVYYIFESEEGIKIESSEMKRGLSSLEVGDRFKVNYSSLNPENCRILIDQPVN